MGSILEVWKQYKETEFTLSDHVAKELFSQGSEQSLDRVQRFIGCYCRNLEESIASKSTRIKSAQELCIILKAVSSRENGNQVMTRLAEKYPQAFD